MTAAATVDKALALIGAQVFDTAMLDMKLNGATGHSVAEALVARGLAFCLLQSQHGCVLPAVGSAASISPTSCPTTRHSRSIVTPASVTAAHVTPGHTSCERAWCGLTDKPWDMADLIRPADEYLESKKRSGVIESA